MLVRDMSSAEVRSLIQAVITTMEDAFFAGYECGVEETRRDLPPEIKRFPIKTKEECFEEWKANEHGNE